MKRIVNGKLTDLQPSGDVRIKQSQDRLWVHSEGRAHSALVAKRGDETLISFKGRVFSVKQAAITGIGEAEGDSGEIRAPLPGQIVEVSVGPGDAVVKGQRLMVMEAMKMQQALTAPFDGTIDKVLAKVGDQASEGQLLIHVNPNQEA